MLLDPLAILQVDDGATAPACRRAVDVAGRLALDSGAVLYTSARWRSPSPFGGGGGQRLDGAAAEQDPVEWARGPGPRLLLIAGAGAPGSVATEAAGVAAVRVDLDPWHSETTLFAESGLADQLGDPAGRPLVPGGHYAAATIGYAAFSAVCAVAAGLGRTGRPDTANVEGLAALTWVNWKAVAAGWLGEDIHRRGDRAEWPVLRCLDGHVALVHTDRDWPALVAAVGDERLAETRMATPAARRSNHATLVRVLGEWTAGHTRAELDEVFDRHGIPGGAVLTPAELLTDPLLVRRDTFTPESELSEGRGPVAAPVRIAAREPAATAPPAPPPAEPADGLPLSGVRILDLGMITAGAGTTGILADLGAEVLKIEAPGRPDPFRAWAGADESPLFNFNNRNKLGIALDLKTDEGRAAFLDLVAGADAVVENFRRGVLDRLGLGFDQLREANPRILLASVSSQGLDGPGTGRPSFGTTLEATAGFAALTCADDGVPVVSGRNINYPDQIVCLYAAGVITAGIVRCLDAREAIQLDVSQRDVAVHALGDVIASLRIGGDPTIGRRELAQRVADHPRATMLACADGRWLGVTIDADDDTTDLDALATTVAALGVDDAVATLRARGFGAAKVSYGSELLEHPTLERARAFVDSPSGRLVKGFPFTLVRGNQHVWADAPAVGEHTDRYLDR